MTIHHPKRFLYFFIHRQFLGQMAYSKVPTTRFELTMTQITDLKVLDRFGTFREGRKWFNPAIGGCFYIENQATDMHQSTWKVRYDSAAMTLRTFDILVAVWENNELNVKLRLFTNENEVFCAKLDSKVSLNYGNLPDQHKTYTALVLCVTSIEMNIDVAQENGLRKTITWSTSSLVMSPSLSNELPNARIEPSRLIPCSECLVVSTDGRGHVRPCPPKLTISDERELILSDATSKVFQMRFGKDCHIQVLDGDIGKFVDIYSGKSFFNEIVGIFNFKTFPNNSNLLTFETSSIKRFSVIFAFFHKKAWRLRLRLVITTTNGIIAYPLTKTLFITDGKIELPNEFQANTALLIGIHTTADAANFALRVYANTTGYIHETFNGYECGLTWDRKSDTISIPDCLKTNNLKRRIFSVILYHASVFGTHTQVVGNLAEQRLTTPPLQIHSSESECEQVCLTIFVCVNACFNSLTFELTARIIVE